MYTVYYAWPVDFLYFVNLYDVKVHFNYIMLFLKFIVMKLVNQVC